MISHWDVSLFFLEVFSAEISAQNVRWKRKRGMNDWRDDAREKRNFSNRDLMKKTFL